MLPGLDHGDFLYNFLFIVIDDLNSWIGALGRHPQTKTPNIDALAQRGCLFVNAYCSAPYCNASRMGMFSGSLPSSIGVYQNEPFWNSPGRPATLIERLREAGYYTFGAGKVFHGTYDYEAAGRLKASVADWRDLENRGDLWDTFHALKGEVLPPGRPLNRLFDFDNFEKVPSWYHHFDWGPSPAGADSNLPDALTVEEVERFLESRPSQPFFAAAGIYKPHLPWHAPGRFFDMHPRDEIIVPIVRDDDLDDAPPLARSWALSPPDHELVTSRAVWKDAVQGYLACISYADELVGRMIAALDRSTLGPRTAVVLCGDNGFHLGEKLHWRKFALWEEATRVPLIFVSPSGAPGIRVNEPVSLIDVYPTVLRTAGLSPEGHDAFDLAPLMTNGGNAQRPRPPITTWQAGNHSIRTRRWRFTRYVDGGRELFDHAADPREWTNLANRPEYDTLSAALEAQIDAQCGFA